MKWKWRVLMTKYEIHIRSLLRKKGWKYNPEYKTYNKYKWKRIEKNKKESYCNVILRVDATKQTVRATIYTDLSINSLEELEKYYIVYNRTKDMLKEMGLELI